MAGVREFDTGANRDGDTDKLDFEGFYHPLVMQRFAEYMHANRHLADGTMRDSDNWQKGIPLDVYMKSGTRHWFDWYSNHRGVPAREDVEKALCGLLFNAQGYLYEILKAKQRSVNYMQLVVEVSGRIDYCVECNAEHGYDCPKDKNNGTS